MKNRKGKRGLSSRAPVTGRRAEKEQANQNQASPEGAQEEPFVPETGDASTFYEVEDISLDGDHAYSLDAATDTEYAGLSESAESVMAEIERYTENEDIEQDFAERQLLNSGRDDYIERLREHHSKSPELSGGDVDARWEDADVSGEETVGSTVPTPDQDRVDDLGKAMGIRYEDGESLATADKLDRRDKNRWELSPASMQGDNGEEAETDDLDSFLEDELDDDEDDDEDDSLDDDLADEYADEIEEELGEDEDVLEDEDEDLLDDLENDLSDDIEDEDLDDFLFEDDDE